MTTEVNLPELGENIEEAEVLKVLVSEGDEVEKGQDIVELETDKAAVELPSPAAGRVKQIAVKAGDHVHVGATVLTLETADEKSEEKEQKSEKQKPEKQKPEKPKPGKSKPETSKSEEKAAAPKSEETESEEAKSEETEPEETEPEETKAEAREPEPLKREVAERAEAEPSEHEEAAAPVARKLARELGVDLAAIHGTGSRGRITPEDVKAHVRGLVTTRTKSARELPPLPDFAQWGEIERQPMSGIRRKTAAVVDLAWQLIPHVTHFDAADVTALEAERERLERARAQGPKVTLTALLLRACARVLPEFPAINASLDSSTEELVLKKYVNIGVAVDTEHGLLVPVVRDADRKTLAQIAGELNELAGRARKRKLSADELKGASFTITNLGGIGGTAFTPIIHHPQAAILGVASTRNEVAPHNGSTSARLMLPLCLSYDHRIVDGALAARFLRRLANVLEHPSELVSDQPGTIVSQNPATELVDRRFAPLRDHELAERLERAGAAFRAWRATPFADRATALGRVAERFTKERERLSRLMVEEMGKTIRAARAEIDKCALACRHYADHGEAMLAEDPVVANGERRSVVYQPLGPLLAIMPWNFPFWQVVRCAAPALMAGNVVLIKHASNVPRCALALDELFRGNPFVPDVFQTLLIETEQVPELIADARIVAVTLTGSDRAGAAVAELAGRHLKKVVLELGGSDPFIVMPSADLDAAVRTAVTARTLSNGQSCIAAKRFIVHEAVFDRFAQGLADGLRQLRVGDPMREETDVGPLATQRAREHLVAQIERSVAMGARVLVGAKPLPGPGWFFEPGVLADIPRDSPAHREEIFGPVALLYRARDLDDAIAIANDSPYGLGAAAWTSDADEAARFVRDLEAGSVFINAMVVSDPRLPFGGVKRSGFGRELGVFGIREFVNIKTVSRTGIERP